MRDASGTYKIDRSRIFEHRLRARLVILVVFFILFIFQLLVGISRNDNEGVGIAIYMFAAILGFTLFVCVTMSTRAERTVIVIDKKDIKRLIDGNVTTVIANNEIGSMKEITNGFLIIRKFHEVERSVYKNNIHEDMDTADIIYVPKIMEGYMSIYNFVALTIRENGR